MLLFAPTQSQYLPNYGYSVFLALLMQEVPSDEMCLFTLQGYGQSQWMQGLLNWLQTEAALVKKPTDTH